MKRMKHNYILGIAISLLFMFSSTTSKASHIMGGDLTFTCLGGNTYMIQLRLFRDCNGIALNNTATINLTSPTCGTMTHTLNLLNGYPQDITPLCGTYYSQCATAPFPPPPAQQSQYGVHEYVYKGPITLTGCWANATDITFSWSSCCRNNAITTLNNAGSFYLNTELNTQLSPCNNSPDFLNSPVAFFCVGQPVNYNHGAADPDNDSLVFSLVDCQTGAGTSVAYTSPYSGLNPLQTNGGVAIDPSTGGLLFTPTTTQVGVLCVRVEEYRNGQKIGEVIRDMQFTIVTCNNDLPTASGIDGTASSSGTTGAFALTVCANDTVNFSVSTYDANIIDNIIAGTPDSVEMTWNQAIQGATFTSNSVAQPTGTFNWVPTNGDVGNNIFTVNLKDQGCPISGVSIYSFLITVLEEPEMDAGPSQVTCSPGDTVNLNGSFTTTTGQFGSFTWVPSHGLSSTNSQSIQAGPDSTTTYTASVVYSNGCTYTDSVIIEVTDGITLPIMTDTTICQGSVQLDATISTSIGGGLSFSNDTVKTVPDNDPAGVRSYITTSGVSPAAMGATTIDSICITANHILSSDLDIYLIAPNGVQIELTTDNGTGSNYTGTCFVPVGGPIITSGNSPFTGSFLPEGNFNNFVGAATNGVWQLLLVDDSPFFSGSLQEWSIHFGSPNQVNYSWTPSATLSCTTCPDPLATPNVTTTYTVVATNQNGCTDTGSVVIEVNDTLHAPIINCAGITPNALVFCWDTLAGATGYEVNVDNTGWVTPNGPGGQCHTVTGLAVTQTVNIQVRGISNCPNATILIGTQNCTTAPCTLDGTLGSTTDVSCNGGSDGAVTINSSGGTLPHVYSLDGGVTTFPTGTFTGLPAGSYIATVIDSFACVDTVLFTINEPMPIMTAMSTDSVSCFGGNDGTATVVTTGGSGGYTYQWSGVVGNIPNITGLTAGTYTLTVTDGNNCTALDTVIVLEPDSITLTSTSFDVSCNGAGDGSITVTATGGNGTYNYAWTGSASTSNIASTLSGGIYSVTATDFKGCTQTLTDTINENSALVLTVDSIPALCNTSLDGAGIVVATGGSGTYSYLWDAAANNQITDTATALGAGTYTVTVTDSDGCSDQITATVTSPTDMTSSMTSTSVFCHNSVDGTATITVSGGTGAYSYQWVNSNDNAATADSLGVGFQAVTVTDGNGCTIVDSVQITGPTPISITLTPTAVTCFGNADGAVTTTVTGGAGGYTYAWSNTAVTQNINNISGGIYMVTVTDINGCSDTASAFVNEPVSLTITLTNTDVSCFNGSDGSATVAGTGGTMPYVYLWSPSNQGTPTANNIPAGWHTVTVTDALGCSAVDSVFVNQPATGVTTSISSTPLVCNGDGSGTATVLATGGSGNYTFAWNTTPVQNTSTATGLQAGTYTSTVSDVNGCTYIDSVIVTEPTPVISTITMTATSCNGYSDGTATVTPAGGVGNYTYAWSTTPVQTDSMATNLVAGTYTVTVTDGNNCTTTNTIVVTEPNGMTLTMSMTPVSCNSGTDGTAMVGVTGGTTPYAYSWSSFAGDVSNATGLSAGMHYVTVTDANGCFKVDSIQVTEPDTLTVTTTGVDVSCFGGTDGSATAIPVGGTTGYTFAWSTTPTQVTPTATGLTTGTYTVTVTDANGCMATNTVFIGQPASGVTTTTSFTPVNCNAGSDGTATVSAVGGAGGYTYLWSNTQTSATATGLQAGSYTVTVTDQNGCFVTDQVTISEPAAITLIAGQTSTSCFAGDDGTATVAASGGVPSGTGAYSYVWNSTPAQATQTATGLNGGQTYTVTVTDENGCTATTSVTIDQPTQVQLTTTQTNVSCNGFTDGDATVLAGGGTPGYTYQWDANAGGQMTNQATGLGIGTFTVTVTDFNSCTEEINVTITEPAPLSITSVTTDVVCKGEPTGEATILAAGGTPWYGFQWDANAGNRTSNIIDGLVAGSYTVTMTDANNCQITETITIEEPAEALLASFAPEDVTCFGDRDGQISVNAQGGAIPYQYSINNESYSNATTLVGLTAGEYIVNVRDDVGCVYSDTVTINEPAELIVDAGPDLLVEYGTPTPIIATIENGQIPFTYSWTPADSLLSCTNCPIPMVTPQNDNFYQIMVTDANGCIGVDQVAVRVQKIREVYVATGFTPNNDGINDALFVQGGEESMNVVEFKVFDRWGETVYNAADTPLNDPTFGWDGTLRGQPMNSGVYGWIVVVEFQDGERKLYKGNTTLIR